MTTPRVDPLPPRDPADMDLSHLPDPNALKAMVAPVAVADQCLTLAQAEEDTARLPSSVPLHVDTDSSSVLPSEDQLLAGTDSSSVPPSRDKPLAGTDNRCALLARARALAALAARARALVALVPEAARARALAALATLAARADLAALAANRTMLAVDLLVFARESKAKKEQPRAIDQAESAVKLKLLPSVLRATVVLRSVLQRRLQ